MSLDVLVSVCARLSLCANGLIHNRYFNVIQALKHNCVHATCTNALKIAFILKPISVRLELDGTLESFVDDVANADIEMKAVVLAAASSAQNSSQRIKKKSECLCSPAKRREIERGNRSANKLDYYKLIKSHGSESHTHTQLTRY